MGLPAFQKKVRESMNILNVLQIIIAIATILTELVSLIWPKKAEGFTGLTAPGNRGISEIRSVLGGTFLGLGIAVLILSTQAAYQTLGITYLTIGVIRAISIVLDKSREQSNIISLVVEIIFGLLLVL